MRYFCKRLFQVWQRWADFLTASKKDYRRMLWKCFGKRSIHYVIKPVKYYLNDVILLADIYTIKKHLQPNELTHNLSLILCHRCNKHVTRSVTTPPPKAYWKNLDPATISDELQQQTQPKECLLSRIIPFVKIVKFNRLLG